VSLVTDLSMTVNWGGRLSSQGKGGGRGGGGGGKLETSRGA